MSTNFKTYMLSLLNMKDRTILVNRQLVSILCGGKAFHQTVTAIHCLSECRLREAVVLKLIHQNIIL